jgi:diguanylate cyclase (GGDEF)-like protein
MAGKQARILVVDDAQVMRRAAEKMLENDYQVILAVDGEAGWEALQQDAAIDLLLTDIMMPRLDGYGLICRVRADSNPRIRDLPIVTMTGAEDDETRIRAYACGSTDFLVKPFDRKLLTSRVHAYLRQKQASLLHATAVSGGGTDVDALTQLKGLGGFLEAGKQLFQQAREQGHDLSLAALEVDDFANLAQTHSAAETDALLKQVAQSFTSTVRREDVAARVGTAEFAVLIPHAGREPALKLCERVRERVAATPVGAISMTASMGLVTLSTDAPETFEKALVLVEQRLTQARSDGGNRVGVTLLSDVMPQAEEVVLTAVPGGADLGENENGEIEIAADAGGLSVEELEAMVRQEVARQRAAVRNS